MNFFRHQAEARSNTTRLVLLFALAIASLIGITLLFLMFCLAWFSKTSLEQELLNAQHVISVSALIIGVVLLAWLYKSIQLASGGKAVAEAMGGIRIPPNTDDPDEKKVLNIVEEMAIASGIAVPPVYLIQESGINAFAAGHHVRNAVIGITRGCIHALNRDELQGVIAHEFSHIFNGDMRLNIRLISILHGIEVIGMIGRSLLDSNSRQHGYHRRRYHNGDNRSAGGLIALGLGLLVIGTLGHYFGSLIKAAVSRQREFLADASAVQYTRNPQGIGNALRKIGGFPLGAYVNHPEAHEISHLFFCDAISNRFFSRWLSTHPPLRERIKRVDPYGGNTFIKVSLHDDDKIDPQLLRPSRKGIAIDDEAYKAAPKPETLKPIDYFNALSSVALTPAIDGSTEQLIEYAGMPTARHVQAAHVVLEAIPEILNKSAHDHFDVQALIYCMLLDHRHANVHEQQLNYLEQKLPADIYREVCRLKEQVAVLPPRHRLPLMEIALGTLKQLSKEQYLHFKVHMIAMIKADRIIDLREWSLYRMVVHHMEDKGRGQSGGRKNIHQLHVHCQRLLSAIALASSEDGEAARQSFDSAWAGLSLPVTASLQEDAASNVAQLEKSLMACSTLHPLKKPQLIKACCAALHDPEDPEGIELIRIMADALDVPLPLLIQS